MVNATCLLAAPDEPLKHRLTLTLRQLGLTVRDIPAWPDTTAPDDADLVITVATPACCAWLRPGSQRPAEGPALVLVLMPGAEVVDRVLALRWGADAVLDPDQISSQELAWRLQALLRRRPLPLASQWQLDVSSRQLRRGTLTVDLSPTELAVLLALVPRSGQTLTRGEILCQPLMRERGCQLNAVELAVSRLRSKFARMALPCPLITDRGYGYRWQDAP